MCCSVCYAKQVAQIMKALKNHRPVSAPRCYHVNTKVYGSVKSSPVYTFAQRGVHARPVHVSLQTRTQLTLSRQNIWYSLEKFLQHKSGMNAKSRPHDLLYPGYKFGQLGVHAKRVNVSLQTRTQLILSGQTFRIPWKSSYNTTAGWTAKSRPGALLYPSVHVCPAKCTR